MYLHEYSDCLLLKAKTGNGRTVTDRSTDEDDGQTLGLEPVGRNAC